MLKLWGAALTAVGCAALGIRRGQDLKQGVDTLNQLVQGLALLEHELRLQEASLPVLMERLRDRSHGAARQLFTDCVTGLARLDERPFARTWEAAVVNLNGLCPEGRELLFPLGQCLGRYDAAAQCQAVKEVCRQLEQLRREKWMDSRRLGRVYQMMGLAGGVFLMILLL